VNVGKGVGVGVSVGTGVEVGVVVDVAVGGLVEVGGAVVGLAVLVAANSSGLISLNDGRPVGGTSVLVAAAAMPVTIGVRVTPPTATLAAGTC
jgi:hypothetical protein